MFKGLNKLPRITVLTTVALTSIFGCQNKPTSIQDKQNNNITKNFVSLNDGTMIDKNIGDDKIQFTVLNHSVLAQKLVDREYLQPTATQAKSLLASKINSSIKNDAFFSDKKDREKKKEKKDTKNATPDFTNNFIKKLND
jgi:hypothetical protein